MEKNTVTLGLEEYNELHDFKNKIEEKYTKYVYYFGISSGYHIRYITTEEAVEEIAEANKSLEKRIDDLHHQLQGETKDPTIEEIKRMSLWEFLRWKKK